VHLENELCDVLSLQEGRCGWPLRDVMRRIAEEGSGVIIVLRQIKDTDDLLRELNSFAENHIPQSTTKTSPKDLKTYGIGAQILNDLGVKKMRVMSAPKRFHGIGGFGLEIVDYVQS
ncbi:MAG TPA: bifunctional 3,4-dihydroxy-2-butanone-4-phosphate synthase/GTP cyclohydrolase II, partial [Thiothrix sp.]|nr:bifunctional 3,4-dihydroxy-2-butanone-4-phosphate synthase/GTP cyclohydrolase II [Thiothrix sp.]